VVAVARQRLDGGIGELFPTLALVARSLMGTHGKGGIEQQHALFRPSGKVARSRHWASSVVVYFLEYVLKRRGKRHAIVHGETQPVRLPGFMVWVLTYDNHFHLVKRTQVESVENKASRRITPRLGVLRAHERCQILEILLVELTADVLPPRLFNLYIQNVSMFGFYRKQRWGKPSAMKLVSFCRDATYLLQR